MDHTILTIVLWVGAAVILLALISRRRKRRSIGR
jgi:LPXTG-motif cell wall-anchored protein